MKKTINYILAAVAVFAAASCQKFETVKNVEETTAPVRTLTAVFEEGSKTTADSNDGVTYAKWAVGDTIRVMDNYGHSANHGIDAGDKISEDGKKVTFDVPGEVTGDQIYAIHGDTKATVTAGVINFTIPATQDGTFNTANICVAKADENGTLTFKNATAIIKIISDNKEEVNYLILSADDGQFFQGQMTASFDEQGEISVTGPSTGVTAFTLGEKLNLNENLKNKKNIFSEKSEYYIAVAAGNNYTLNVEKYNPGTSGGDKNKVASIGTWKPSSKLIEAKRNKIYKITIGELN